MNKKIFKFKNKFINYNKYENKIDFIGRLTLHISFLQAFIGAFFMIVGVSVGIPIFFSFILTMIFGKFTQLYYKNNFKLIKNNNDLISKNKNIKNLLISNLKEYYRQKNKDDVNMLKQIVNINRFNFIDQSVSTIDYDHNHQVLVETTYNVLYDANDKNSLPKIKVNYDYYDLNNVVNLLDFYKKYGNNFNSLILQKVTNLENNIEKYIYNNNSNENKDKLLLIESANDYLNNLDIENNHTKEIKIEEPIETKNTNILLGKELIKDIEYETF